MSARSHFMILCSLMAVSFTQVANSEPPQFELDPSRPTLHPSANLLGFELFPRSKKADVLLAGRRWSLLTYEKNFKFFIEPAPQPEESTK